MKPQSYAKTIVIGIAAAARAATRVGPEAER